MTATTVGIDIGTESTKVNLGPSFSCEIVRTGSGGHTTPTAVSFSSGNPRQIGETASLKGKNSVIHLNRLPRGHLREDDPFAEFYMFDHSKDVASVEYNNVVGTKFEAAALLAMLFGRVKQNVDATIQRLSSSSSTTSTDVEYHISVSKCAGEEERQDYLDAAYAAGLSNAKLIESSECYGAAYERKFPEYISEEARIVLIIDMGHCATTISVLQMGGSNSAVTPAEDEGEKEEDKNDNEEEEKKQDEKISYKVLTSKTVTTLGAGSVDIRLWNHFKAELPALKDIQAKSRKGQRLLDGCKKLKHLLSQLPEGSVMVENVGMNDTDLHLKGMRSTLSNICQPEKDSLIKLIQSTIEEANIGGETTIASIEVLGGGCRIPWVKEAILEAASEKCPSDMALSHSLDDTSVALGAALSTNGEQQKTTTSDRCEKLLEQEKNMTALDDDLKTKADIRNKIESHILEIRSAKHSKHGNLIPSSIDAYLDELDDWLFSEESDTFTKEQMKEKLDATLQNTKELCHEYFDAVEKEAAAKEREMEEEAKKAQLERAGQEEGEEDDHDNRRLPKKRRMEIVMKNKAEANELFSDGNYKFAAARYTKALSHCAKFVDLSPDDIKEVNGVKLSLNLNLALAYTKLKKPSQALRVCNDALSIDEQSAKALYRRASVQYELKKWDDAKSDIQKAIKLVPDDKAIKKLSNNVDIMIKRQKAKEKKMAQKMFG